MTRGNWGRWLGYAALGVVLYGLFLLVFAPAEYFARGIAAASNNTISLYQPAGSLWNGSANVVTAHTGAAPIGQLQWRIRPWHLLAGSLVAELKLAGADINANVVLGVGLKRYAARDLVATTPIRTVALFYPAVETMGLNGDVRLTSAMFEVRDAILAGSAELVWEGASSGLLPIAQAGDYRLTIAGQGGRANLRLETTRGILQANGEGEWRAFEDGVLRFQGTIASVPPQPQLDTLLDTIGQRRADGKRVFNVQTKLLWKN